MNTLGSLSPELHGGCTFGTTPSVWGRAWSRGEIRGMNLEFITWNRSSITIRWGEPWGLSGEESACQCRRCRFNPWVGKIPWRRKWQAAPAFLPGESRGLRNQANYSPWGCEETTMTEASEHAGVHTAVWIWRVSLVLCFQSCVFSVILLLL